MDPTRPRPAWAKGLLVVVAAAAVAVGLGLASTPAGAQPGFLTAEAAMLTPLAPGSAVKPIISVGDTLPSGYRFEAIPDGIGLITKGKGTVHAYVNHETSTFPFPANLAAPTPTNTWNDFDNSQLSKLVIHQKNAAVLSGEYAIPSSAGYQRFCSNFMAGPAEGFKPSLLFTGEEATDVVNRDGGLAWPNNASAEQAGLAVAYDPDTGEYRSIYGLGRMNHENTVAIPGYGHPVLLTDDDTFTAPSSQLYMYLADSRDDVWNDQGHLWAFRSDVPTVNDYGDLGPVAPAVPSVSGEFIPVPDAIADGGQTGLENWSNANNVFQFIRLEDIAYDRNTPHVVYLADTGEPRAIPDPLNPVTGRLIRGPSTTLGPYMNGRIFKLVLDPEDETRVLSLSILINADAGGYFNATALHQPDNLETTRNSLLVQEDPGSHNSATNVNFPNATNARVWRHDLDTASFAPVAEVNQTLDPTGKKGLWESSGIVDVSKAFGAGAFLVAVQAHCSTATPLVPCGAFVETELGPDRVAPAGPDWLFKREGGQLVLLKIPGA